MANFGYTGGLKERLARAEVDWENDTIKAMLVMTNTTFDTEKDAEDFTEITTQDEFDGSGYTAGGETLANAAVNPDDANDEAEMDADNVSWAALGAGTRDIAGIVVYKSAGAGDANQWPLWWIDTVSGSPSFPFTANGSSLTLVWSADGIGKITD